MVSMAGVSQPSSQDDCDATGASAATAATG